MNECGLKIKNALAGVLGGQFMLFGSALKARQFAMNQHH